MPDPALFRVNNVPFSWNSGIHLFNGLPYKGITGVSYKETREVKLVHAAQNDGTPVGITAGIYKVENVSFTLLRESANALMLDLTAFGLGSFGDASFTYILQLFEPITVPNTPSIPSATVISGCRITGVDEKMEVGTDELVTEISVQAMFVTRSIAGALPMHLWSTLRALV